MPVRFQVDADFYDHPKTIGMSDSATALWTRAGSYSAAKLLDGFVPEDVLRTLSTVPDEAASELVRRRLWRKVRGGYRFHQWKERGNLTREQVDAERTADRQRKRRKRQGDQQNENSQVDADSVRPDGEPDSGANPNGIQGLSVSKSVSVSKDPPSPQRGKNGSRRSSNYDYGQDPDFLQFWDTYPRKTAKPKAYEAWKAARKRGTDAQVIIDAAARYRDNPDRKPDYTAYPATWLNGERYNDFDEVTSPQGAVDWWDA